MGHLSKDANAFYQPDEKPQLKGNSSYEFDRNKKNEICWLNQIDKKQYNSTQIVDTCLGWLVGQVAKKRLN